jgi:hypothetical protein
MGQNTSRESETINWNQINTNEMSSTIPDINGISVEAKELISRLNLPDISESNSEFNVDNIFKTNEVKNNIEHHLTEIEQVSPFISTEMYNYLVNKHNENSMVGGGKINEDSETSSTSSSLSSSTLKLSSSDTKTKKNKKNKKNKINKKDIKVTSKDIDIEDLNIKEHNITNSELSNENSELDNEYIELSNENSESSNENITKGIKKNKTPKVKKPKKKYTGINEDYLSYISSSAHTGGNLSESVVNENNYTISTVNTSDINMISE